MIASKTLRLTYAQSRSSAHTLQATGRRRRRTSSSPAPQDVDVNMSSPHKQRKRNHSRSRSRSLSNDTRENRRTRSSKRKELHVSMSDSELGAVEEMVAHGKSQCDNCTNRADPVFTQVLKGYFKDNTVHSVVQVTSNKGCLV